jgi:hypothetical protein
MYDTVFEEKFKEDEINFIETFRGKINFLKAAS